MQVPLAVISADKCTPLLRSFLCHSAGAARLGPTCTHLCCPGCRQYQDRLASETRRLVRTSWWNRGQLGGWASPIKTETTGAGPPGVSKARLTLGSSGNGADLLPWLSGNLPSLPTEPSTPTFSKRPSLWKGLLGRKGETRKTGKSGVCGGGGERALHGRQVPYPSPETHL